MSYPHDHSSSRSHRYTPASDGNDLQYEPTYQSQRYDQQSGMQVDGYNTPQNSTSPYPSGTTFHQTSTQHIYSNLSQSDSLSSPSGYYLSNGTAENTLSSPLAGRGGPAYAQQAPQSPYVRGTACSTGSYESHQQALGRERRHSVRSSAHLPPPGRRPVQGDSHHRGHHGSDGRQSESSTRRQRDPDSAMFDDDDDEELSLEGPRSPPIPPGLSSLGQGNHRRRDTNILAGIGEHLGGRRLYQSDSRVMAMDPMIYGGSTDHGRDMILSQSPEFFPSSLTSSMASLAVYNGSAQGSRDDYIEEQPQRRHHSNGGASRSSHDRRRPSTRRHEDHQPESISPREQSRRDPHYPPTTSRPQAQPHPAVRSEGMPIPTTQTSHHYEAPGQQMPPYIMGFRFNFTNTSAVIAGYTQLPQQRLHLESSNDRPFNVNGGDEYLQYPSESGADNPLSYQPPGDGRGNGTDYRYPRY